MVGSYRDSLLGFMRILKKSVKAMILKKSAFVGPLPPLYFGTGLINLVDSYLGVKIDNRLSWSVHIDSVKKHFTQKVGALKRMRILPKQSLEEIYFKSIIPSVTYSISVWGNCSPSAMNSLNSIHERASRIIQTTFNRRWLMISVSAKQIGYPSLTFTKSLFLC